MTTIRLISPMLTDDEARAQVLAQLGLARTTLGMDKAEVTHPAQGIELFVVPSIIYGEPALDKDSGMLIAPATRTGTLVDLLLSGRAEDGAERLTAVLAEGDKGQARQRAVSAELLAKYPDAKASAVKEMAGGLQMLDGEPKFPRHEMMAGPGSAP